MFLFLLLIKKKIAALWLQSLFAKTYTLKLVICDCHIKLSFIQTGSLAGINDKGCTNF